MTLFRTCSLAVYAATATTAVGGEVRLQSADGASIVAEHVGNGENGVLLVHAVGRDRSDWTPFARRLAANGFSVLSIDLRGHGASPGDESGEVYAPLAADVAAGIAWLDSRGMVAVVGAESGANLSLLAASDHPGVDAVVLLSPALNAGGVTLSGPLASWEGPLLVVADETSPTRARTATLIVREAVGKARAELVDAGVSGHRMLNAVAGLEAVLIGWLNGSRGAAEGASLARPERALEGGSIDAIETTGTRYGEEE